VGTLRAITPAMAEPEPNTKYDVVDAWDRAQHLLVPRFMFPFLAAFFVLLCGGMAVILFAIGKLFGGTLFAGVVLVGLYVVYCQLVRPR
jgi:hypothetical protein